jgi:hypothetical protein
MKINKQMTAVLIVMALSLVSQAQTSKSNLSPIGNWVGFAENQGNQDQLTVTIEKRTTSTPERSKTPWECSRMSTSRTLS